MAAKIYWRDARFRPNDNWMRENMDRSLVKQPYVPFPGEIPNFSCCPYGKYMYFDIPGENGKRKQIALPSEYKDEDPAKFPQYDSDFDLLKHKITTNGVFADYKPFVAEGLRRNEKDLFSAYDSHEDSLKHSEKKRKEEITVIVSNPANSPNIKRESAEYSIILDGRFVSVGAHGSLEGEGYYFIRVEIDAEKPIYSQALYHIFETNPHIMNHMVREFKPHRFVGKTNIETIIEQNHEVIGIWLRKSSDDARQINWALRTIADHPAFKKLRPEIDLELLVA